MDGMRLADRLAYGAGCAARRAGFLHDAYRPDGPEGPVALDKRFLRLCVAFVLPGGSVAAPSGFGVPFRQAWADWSYLRAGDYLAGPEGTVFVAAIEPPKPMLVVMTNAVVSLARPAAPVLAGLNGYGAVLPGTQTMLLAGFPASLLVGGMGERTRAGLPDDTKVPGFSALLPVVAGVRPHVADILKTDGGERFIVTAVEQMAAVWRFTLAQEVS
ncbi:hypothetical protein GCM10010909_22500 [Acidocella aquatica]|uniref:Rhodanese domain-containing protein n=1 Tax=Acidocella aquatica TaxID=1922313 RepID=A0ABQ6A527_9PROT|nr:hypothetical protein [Acidocella aquatica]GLR67569.1 hypothetical protein GCM10010909_22500 [Acidocella aquatica]